MAWSMRTDLSWLVWRSRALAPAISLHSGLLKTRVSLYCRLAVFDISPARSGSADAAADSGPQSAKQPSGGLIPGAAASSVDAPLPQLELQNGAVSGLRAADGGLATALNISMRWYNSSDGADGAIASGAYIFRFVSLGMVDQTPGVVGVCLQSTASAATHPLVVLGPAPQPSFYAIGASAPHTG